MMNEHSGLSRRKLLRTTAIGVPAAGMLAFGSTLVTATSANAIEVDGWWGEETSAGLQRFMNVLFPDAHLVVDGVISSQPLSMQPSCPGIVGGWEWVDDAQAVGSPTIFHMYIWLSRGRRLPLKHIGGEITPELIGALQKHYGDLITSTTLIGGSNPIDELQNEINHYVG
ncbi:peptidoglycan-binding protein [Rothia dentocariosa]|uniref:peptidoglycan-binding protein n=1 Tax=Rothia dentocariosa TaxID=2047 RepID=UPI0014554CBA|nr:peptidoglycan-binding protein [Rothia dentocariosa]NLR26307.1 peptidoglycan-binding protein [Rothia dentocariosa]